MRQKSLRGYPDKMKTVSNMHLCIKKMPSIGSAGSDTKMRWDEMVSELGLERRDDKANHHAY